VEVKTIALEPDDFAFSPDAKRIVYEIDGDLYVISASGSKPRQLTAEQKTFGPVWDKPGIAFVRSFRRG
jgi:hypothetical protein